MLKFSGLHVSKFSSPLHRLCFISYEFRGIRICKMVCSFVLFQYKMFPMTMSNLIM